MAPEEQEILKVKYILPRFPNLPAVDLPRHAKGLLVRIHTITGWKLPDDEFFLNTLVSEFAKYLVERCADLNPEEVGYAIRNYGMEVKDWGKSMNLALIDEPIREYRERRSMISNFEEARKKAEEVAKIKALPVGEVDWSEEWSKAKEAIRKGHIRDTIILTPMYDWLERKGMISIGREEKIVLLKKCREAYVVELEARIIDGHREQDILKTVKRDDWMTFEDVMTRIKAMAKIEAVRMLAQKEEA